MQQRPNNDDRKVVPRWRQFWRTPHSELRNSNLVREATPVLSTSAWLDAVGKWSASDSISTREQLVSLSALGIMTPESEQARALLRDDENARPLLRKLAQRNVSDEEYEAYSDPSENERRAQISLLKDRIALSPRNAIAYVEIARLYSLAGQNKLAERYLLMALALAPSNRYIVRSASRFYVHSHKPDMAFELLQRASADGDPWILAAKIAAAELAHRISELPLKRLRGTLEGDFSPIQLSELSASLATLELGGGNTKRAKRLFKQSSVHATDNSAAQIAWASEKHKLQIQVDLAQVELSFEARARQSYIQQDWLSYVRNAEKWLADEAFSSRPALHGSYAAAELIGDYEWSLRFSLAGLHANPHDVTLLNNAAYAYSELGQIALAKERLETAKRLRSPGNADVALLATEGHICFAVGDVTQGDALYKLAFDRALELKSKRMAEAVVIHWTREQIKIASRILDIDAVRSYFSSSGNADPVSKAIFDAILPTENGLVGNERTVESPLERLRMIPVVEEADDP
jgi:hypothetical protein